MHIAIINSEYPSPSGFDHGGIATYSYIMAVSLAAHGHNVELLLREGTNPEIISDSVRIHFYKFTPPRQTFSLLKFKKKDSSLWELGHSLDICSLLLKINQKERIDIAEFPDYGGLAFSCKNALPFPLIINFHTPSEIVDKFNNVSQTRVLRSWYSFEKKALLNGNGFRCPSNALKSEICKLYKLPESEISVIRNPISTERFDHISKKNTEDRFDILFAGRLERRKGAEILTKSLPLLLQINKNIFFTFAGNTEPGGEYCYRNALERSLTKEQRKRVYFSGPLACEKLAILYCRSSLFLFPSIFENAPYALLEAIAAKLPIVASDCSGINEIVNHNQSGLLFKPDDPEDLAACVQTAFNNYEHCKQMAENAYENLKKEYNPQKITEETICFYQNFITKTHS